MAHDDEKMAALMGECLAELAVREDEARAQELLRQIEDQEPGALRALAARLERRRLRASLH